MRTIFVEILSRAGLPGWLVPNFWFMLSLALMAGSVLTILLWRRRGQPARVASDLIFWGILALLVGMKLLYLAQFGFPSDLESYWAPAGLSLYGGLLGLVWAWTFYYLLRPYPVLAFLDCTAPALGLGLFLGRIGCFLAGCNGGVRCDWPWGVRFPHGTPTFHHQLEARLVDRTDTFSLPAHPTQLYESAFGLAAFFLLLWLLRSGLPKGTVFFSGILWYTVFRFGTEFLRADAGGLRPFGVLTFSQFVSIIGAVAAAVALLWIRRQAAAASADPQA